MKIPKIVKENNREFRFVKKCNTTVYLYEETKYGYKKCFTAFDLNLIKEPDNYQKDRKLEVEKVKYM